MGLGSGMGLGSLCVNQFPSVTWQVSGFPQRSQSLPSERGGGGRDFRDWDGTFISNIEQHTFTWRRLH